MINYSKDQPLFLKFVESKCSNIKNEIDRLLFEVCNYLKDAYNQDLIENNKMTNNKFNQVTVLKEQQSN